MGYFWPIWPAVGWGIGIAGHANAALRTPRRHRSAESTALNA